MKNGIKSVDGLEKTVLVVDDEGAIRRLVCRICKSLGVSRVLDAAHVAGALDLLRDEHVDLVISDLNMPDESGLKIVQALKLAEPRTAVLIFSGSYSEAEKRKVLAAGADMVLRKALNFAELESAICALLHIEPRKGTGAVVK